MGDVSVMVDAAELLLEQLKIVSDHCRETGLRSGAAAVENARAELARLRVVVERVEYGMKENLICHRNHTEGVRCIYCQIRDALAENRAMRAALTAFAVPGSSKLEVTEREVAHVKALETVAEAARETLTLSSSSTFEDVVEDGEQRQKRLRKALAALDAVGKETT